MLWFWSLYTNFILEYIIACPLKVTSGRSLCPVTDCGGVRQPLRSTMYLRVCRQYECLRCPLDTWTIPVSYGQSTIWRAYSQRLVCLMQASLSATSKQCPGEPVKVHIAMLKPRKFLGTYYWRLKSWWQKTHQSIPDSCFAACFAKSTEIILQHTMCTLYCAVYHSKISNTEI